MEIMKAYIHKLLKLHRVLIKQPLFFRKNEDIVVDEVFESKFRITINVKIIDDILKDIKFVEANNP